MIVTGRMGCVRMCGLGVGEGGWAGESWDASACGLGILKRKKGISSAQDLSLYVLHLQRESSVPL